ncbi:hypothetical protein C2G38_2028333 [Gigaspora rosea]|uniref:TLDc domain-containing protein n=1 Tax=Gigaspora rosea TaxID=44941 RepID=A0A397W1S8_9GLOM|nr:hypothetical protein C2G38_2028333 [Gigaspora rosea]
MNLNYFSVELEMVSLQIPWKLCDKQTRLVVVMKVKGTDEILCGYNPIGWDKPAGNSFYKNCNDRFIFSLKNGTIQNSILSRLEQPTYAIHCDASQGPRFGGGCDLVMSNNFNQDRKCWSRKKSYERRIRNGSTYEIKNDYASFFSVDEYEIFRLAKNPKFIQISSLNIANGLLILSVIN